MDCIFCKIINKEIPSKVIYEDDKVLVMLDINPVSDGHALVIPKKHIEDILEVDNETLDYMFKIAKSLMPKIMEKLEAKSLTMLINYGDDQQVKHLHLHLIPDYAKGLNNKNVGDIDKVYEILKSED